MKATNFTVTLENQKRCREWLRCRPSAEELREMEERTKETFSADATRAELLTAALTLKADQDTEALAFLPTLQNFLQWLTEVDAEPEPEEAPEEPDTVTQWHLTPAQLQEAIDEFKLRHADEAPKNFTFTDDFLQSSVDVVRGKHTDDVDVQKLCDIIDVLIKERKQERENHEQRP